MKTHFKPIDKPSHESNKGKAESVDAIVANKNMATPATFKPPIQIPLSNVLSIFNKKLKSRNQFGLTHMNELMPRKDLFKISNFQINFDFWGLVGHVQG